jgi:hypothetical protein
LSLLDVDKNLLCEAESQGPEGKITPGNDPSSLVHYALRYASFGWPVLALHGTRTDGTCTCGKSDCKSPGKHPLGGAGVADATTDADRLSTLFAANPKANIGVALPEGIVAIDIDPRNGGNETWDDFVSRSGIGMVDTVEAITGGGGRHLLFSVPPESSLSGKLGPGVDVKHAGGYIVVEPSMHASGNRYEWEASSGPSDVPVVPAPEPLLKAISRPDFGLTRNRIHLAATYQTTPEQIEELRSALLYIDHDDRETWIKAGHALASLGEVGFLLWDEYSQRSDKYRADDQHQRWVGFHSPKASYRSVFGMAQDRGWKNPMKAKPAVEVDPAEDERSSLSDVADLVKDIKPIQWLVRDLVESETLMLTYGQPGTAKSFLEVHRACCVATGTSFFGRQVNKGKVIYVAGEGHNGLARRFRAWEIENHTRLPRGVLYKSESAVDMLSEKAVSKLARHIEEVATDGHVALVVIDTLARNFGGGDENSTEDMSKFITLVDIHIRQRFGCVVIIVHHSGKNVLAGARGSSALLAAVDAAYEMIREGDAMVLSCKKMKDAEKADDMIFKLRTVVLDGVTDDRGGEVTSAVLDLQEDKMSVEVGKDSSKRPISVRDVLLVLAKGGLTKRELAAALICSDSTAQRIATKMSDLGMVSKTDAGYTATAEALAGLSRTGACLLQQDMLVWKRTVSTGPAEVSTVPMQ